MKMVYNIFNTFERGLKTKMDDSDNDNDNCNYCSSIAAFFSESNSFDRDIFRHLIE